MRIDKWLWAARFFKTRSLAKQAIEKNRINCDGQPVKPSRDIHVGNRLIIQRGDEVIEVDVIALSAQRRGAPEAAMLYRETPNSIEQREQQREQRQAERAAGIYPSHPPQRPNKKQRRQIHRFLTTSND